MTTKQKQSFFQRLTGASHTEENAPKTSFPVYAEEAGETPVRAENVFRERAFAEEPYAREPMPEPADQSDAEGQLTIDVYQTDMEIVIKSTIAGVKPEDLDVSINNDMITIRGERKNEEMVESGSYYYQECYWGSFSRSILLPVDVIAEKIEASLKNGILTIRLPKADVNKVKKIQVRGF